MRNSRVASLWVECNCESGLNDDIVISDNNGAFRLSLSLHLLSIVKVLLLEGPDSAPIRPNMKETATPGTENKLTLAPNPIYPTWSPKVHRCSTIPLRISVQSSGSYKASPVPLY